MNGNRPLYLALVLALMLTLASETLRAATRQQSYIQPGFCSIGVAEYINRFDTSGSARPINFMLSEPFWGGAVLLSSPNTWPNLDAYGEGAIVVLSVSAYDSKPAPTEVEVARLRNFMLRGGTLVFFTEPGVKPAWVYNLYLSLSDGLVKLNSTAVTSAVTQDPAPGQPVNPQNIWGYQSRPDVSLSDFYSSASYDIQYGPVVPVFRSREGKVLAGEVAIGAGMFRFAGDVEVITRFLGVNAWTRLYGCGFETDEDIFVGLPSSSTIVTENPDGTQVSARVHNNSSLPAQATIQLVANGIQGYGDFLVINDQIVSFAPGAFPTTFVVTIPPGGWWDARYTVVPAGVGSWSVGVNATLDRGGQVSYLSREAKGWVHGVALYIPDVPMYSRVFTFVLEHPNPASAWTRDFWYTATIPQGWELVAVRINGIPVDASAVTTPEGLQVVSLSGGTTTKIEFDLRSQLVERRLIEFRIDGKDPETGARRVEYYTDRWIDITDGSFTSLFSVALPLVDTNP